MLVMRNAVAGMAAVTLLWVQAGCGREVGTSARAGERLADSTRYVAQIGGAEESDPKSTLSRVISARLTEDGQHFVVLEGFAPYVKVFRRDGSLRSAFLQAGDGPGEMRSPAALAVSGDSAIMVLGGRGRAAVFDLDGDLRVEAPLLGFPAPPWRPRADGTGSCMGRVFCRAVGVRSGCTGSGSRRMERWR